MKSRVFVVLTSLLFVVVSAPAVELFRYRYRAEDGREFECVFETDEQSAPKTVSEEKAAEIAAEMGDHFFMNALDLNDDDSIPELARKYGVSTQALMYRLRIHPRVATRHKLLSQVITPVFCSVNPTTKLGCRTADFSELSATLATLRSPVFDMPQ